MDRREGVETMVLVTEMSILFDGREDGVIREEGLSPEVEPGMLLAPFIPSTGNDACPDSSHGADTPSLPSSSSSSSSSSASSSFSSSSSPSIVCPAVVLKLSAHPGHALLQPSSPHPPQPRIPHGPPQARCHNRKENRFQRHARTARIRTLRLAGRGSRPMFFDFSKHISDG